MLKIWRDYCNMDDAAFEAILERHLPNQQYTSPAYWNNPTFNAPSQPIVGVCWYEAQAYCTWLSIQAGQPFRLPSEVEWEAAARGRKDWRYSWGGGIRSTALQCVGEQIAPYYVDWCIFGW